MNIEQTQAGQDIIFAIKQALVYEEVKGAFELGSLDAGFYQTMRLKMEGLKGDELTDANSFMRKLMAKRISKIVRLASLSPLAQITDIKLTREEKELYENINSSCNTFRNKIQGEKNV